MKPWPIQDNYRDKLTVFYCRTDENRRHPAGVIVFTVCDWGRGDSDIISRAHGIVAARNVIRLVKAGTCSRDFQQECYPNIKSAELRWRGIGKALRDSGAK
jgi:hypothetical protein